ncbi:response regulator transcription factor [Exilibacterium tricleocarpae]|uniref:Response regulator transcription factor n=1 Tax=Exilibacterium tricleocarpae TaxID=2591008 RepID=A0A545TVA8_9GAMM|nr:response regulator [Exilibacterium tricleocarpae]TQV81148.1 response regulator transcription factor [Exilibacterium tricleocarpae]
MDSKQTVFIVDDDPGIREGLGLLLNSVGQPCELYSSAPAFLDAYDPHKSGCLLLDIRMPRMTGLELQARLNQQGCLLPVIFITGHGDIPMAVEAMRHGALDFIRKPFREQELLDRINEALEVDAGKRRHQLDRQKLLNKIAALSERELEVFYRVAAGEMNKAIALDLGISERTVEVHRSHVMKKLEVRTLAQLVRMKIEADASADIL